MTRNSTNYRSGSLKNKVRLTMSALAFFAALCGIGAFSVVNILGSSFYAVFLPFVFLSLTIIVFGIWLSNKIAYPVEKVSLLAKSYERGVSTTIPKSSGSAETDELAETIARLGGQIEKLVSSMDEVAGGNLDVVLSPVATTDRISKVFQKLLTKVSESIHAKQDLEKLQKAISNLSDEIAPVKLGNLNAKIKTETTEIREISQTLTYLLEEMTEIVRQVKNGSAEARQFSGDVQKTILEVALSDENRIQEMNQASAKLKQIPDTMQKIFEELSQSNSSGNQSLEKAHQGTEAAQENLNGAGKLRRQIQETVKRIQCLNQRAQEIGKIAKTVDDLAQRTNLVALNASLQANDLGEKGRGVVVVSEEIKRLAERAENTGKQIFALNKTVQAEINETENDLLKMVGEVAHLSKLAIETGSALSDAEKYIAGVLSLQNRINSYTNEQIGEAQQAFQILIQGMSETEKSLPLLRVTANNSGKISALLEDLQSLTVDFKIPSADSPQTIISYASPEANISV